jgi:nucleotide-binding universal stress UspA family protein
VPGEHLGGVCRERLDCEAFSCVLAGLDGRAKSPIDDAAAEAERRGLPLALVTVIRRRRDPELKLLGLQIDDRQVEAVAWQVLAEAVESVHRDRPELRVDAHCLWEDETTSDRQPFAGAHLLVLGAHGRDGEPALAPGSISCLLHRAAQCPVLLVPETSRNEPRVVRRYRPPLRASARSGQTADFAPVDNALVRKP